MNMMTELYELVRFGGGGFTYEEIYNMPLHIRKFNHNLLLKEYQDKKDQNQESNDKLKMPDHLKSDYIAKTRQK